MDELASTLGSALNNNLVQASGSSSAPATAAASRILEQIAPQTASMTSVNLEYADLLSPVVPVTGTPTKSKDTGGELAEGTSEKKVRWEGRANAVLKAAEMWDEKVEAIRCEVDSVVAAATTTLAEFEGGKGEGVEKWVELVKLRVSGCEAWRSDDFSAIAALIRKIWKRGAVKEEDGKQGAASIVDAAGTVNESMLDEIRHKLPCSDFDELTPFAKLQSMGSEYDSATTMEELKQKRLDHQGAIDKIRVLINQTKGSVTDLMRAKASRASKLQRAAQKVSKHAGSHQIQHERPDAIGSESWCCDRVCLLGIFSVGYDLYWPGNLGIRPE